MQLLRTLALAMLLGDHVMPDISILGVLDRGGGALFGAAQGTGTAEGPDIRESLGRQRQGASSYEFTGFLLFL